MEKQEDSNSKNIHEIEKRVSDSLHRFEMKQLGQTLDTKQKLELIHKMCKLTNKDSVPRSYLEKILVKYNS